VRSNVGYLLFVPVFLIFPGASFGDESSHMGSFNDYINSPESSSGSSVDKNTGSDHKTHDETGKKSEDTDTGPALQGIPAQWKACAMDSDCTAGVADCESWEPLNKKYLPKLSENLNSCSASIDPGFQPQTVCVDKACKITEKTTNVSWEEWLNEMQKRRVNEH
jgi:hypothetical protein